MNGERIKANVQRVIESLTEPVVLGFLVGVALAKIVLA